MENICSCNGSCSTTKKISVFDRSFFDLWLQKCLRNLASMKFQLMLLLYFPIIYGMFNINTCTNEPWISATMGLGFLGGSFLTLATTRIIAKTRLSDDSETDSIDTDK